MKKNDFMDMLLVSDNPLEVYGINDENSLSYFIPDIERIIRSSREYRGWVFLNKSKNKQSKDVFTKIDSFEYNLTLEIHHVIFLYDIVYITGLKMLSELPEGEVYTTFQIADRVIRDHLEGIIPIVPMFKTFHELYHEGLQDFNKEHIFGDYQVWLDRYGQFIPEARIHDIYSNLKLIEE